MTFKSKCNQFLKNGKNINLKNANFDDSNYVYCNSLNASTNLFLNGVLDSNIKCVIVGTLTPEAGRNNGYFYSSPKNVTMKILDNYFKPNSCKFADFAQKLNNNKKDKNIIDAIKDELTQNKIAFLDVVKDAIASKKSASDKKIKEFNLDITSFAKIDDDMSFICNSRNSEYALLIILQTLIKSQNIKINNINEFEQWKNYFDSKQNVEQKYPVSINLKNNHGKSYKYTIYYAPQYNYRLTSYKRQSMWNTVFEDIF